MKIPVPLSLTAVVVGLVGCALTGSYAVARSERLDARLALRPGALEQGALRFMLDDYSALSTETLETYATPWKVATTAILLYANDGGAPFSQAGVMQAFARFGYQTTGKVVGWPQGGGPPPPLEKPLGVVSGMLSLGAGLELEVANNGCAVCHGGRGWSADGAPSDLVYLGLPSSSLDLEAYANALFRAFGAMSKDDPKRFIARVEELWPKVSKGELRAIEVVVLPRVRDRMRQVEGARGFVPYPIGEPGLTNGVASIKLQLGLLQGDASATEHAYTSIPDLSYRALRSSLLYDGIYAPQGAERFREMTASDVTPEHVDRMGAIPAVFTVGTLGMKPSRAHENIARTREVFRWIVSYRAPPFPGPIDDGKAAAGKALFDARCQSCHGEYDATTRPATLVRFPNKLVKDAKIQTDPVRWQAVEGSVERRFQGTEFAAEVATANTGGYVAPILAGVWATAPYLHNGSVPTLWDVLHPQTRPARFPVGGHRLDFAKVGIDLVDDGQGGLGYPPGYVPWAGSKIYDTTKTGHGNGGHTTMFEGLDDAQLGAIIEFLKTL